MKKEFRRDNRLRQLNKKREKCRNTMNNHHLVPESRGGNKSPSNMLMISVWKHDCWHELFKNRTINEIIIFIDRTPALSEKYPEEWKMVFRNNNTIQAIKILKRLRELKSLQADMCVAKDEYQKYFQPGYQSV